MAGALNAHGRLLYFYGVGICVASDYNDHVPVWMWALLRRYMSLRYAAGE